MTTELGLRLPAPAVTTADVDRLCAALAGHGWMTAATLRTLHGYNDRELRAIAEASAGRVLSGQSGYRLFDATTPLGEADRAAAWLESQAKKMLGRAAAIRRRVHSYGRVA